MNEQVSEKTTEQQEAEAKANQEMQDNLQKGDRIIARNRMAQLTALTESETICGEWRH